MKIRNKKKAKIIALLSTIAFLFVGTGCAVLGCYLSGVDVLSAFTSPLACACYGIIIVVSLVATGLIIKAKLYEDGGE